MSHRPNSAVAVMYLITGGPPNSPPTLLLLRTRRIMIAMTASVQNSVTEKAKLKRNEMSLRNVLQS